MATPQRFSGRAGSQSSGRLRRALDGQIDTARKLNTSLDVDKDGRLGTKLARDSGLKMTRQGLMVDPVAVGDKNHSAMDAQQPLATGAATADIITAFNALVASLKKTKRMR